MHIDLSALSQNALTILTAVGLKVLGAIVIWIIASWLIRLAQTLMAKLMNQQHLDPTVISYIRTSIGALLKLALVIALLGYFGVETTTFAALLAAVGIAIGAAWSGLLSNFAAGLFLIILRPFKVGDFVSAAGVTGTIREIGLFGTVIDSPDNVLTTVGNTKIFSDTIQNFSANPYRRVELTAQLDHTVDPLATIQILKARLAAIPNVLITPSPDVEILGFNDAGTQLAVRPYCHNKDYWQVYFDTNKLIYEAFSGAGYPAPVRHLVVRQQAAAKGA